MKKEEIPFEMAVLVDLLKPPSIEEELSMEKDIRQIQSSNDIEELIEQRRKARMEKDFLTSDQIRDDLFAQGIVLEDGATGTTWRRGG